VGAWLEGSGPLPDALAERPELRAQLQLPAEASARLERARERAGALSLETVEARPVMAEGRVIDIALVEANRARELIESFMVAANVAMAGFLNEHQIPAIRRVVSRPRRWGSRCHPAGRGCTARLHRLRARVT
jgi:exoribonuclease-2